MNAGAVMEGIDQFDAAFFGMSRREAELTDPQHRVFLECAWTAIEHAGYFPGRMPGVSACSVGSVPTPTSAITSWRIGTCWHGPATTRCCWRQTRVRDHPVAYKMGLRGPAISVNTACSTSAVAVHLAVQSLLSGETDLALAGGCRIRVPSTAGYLYQEDGILSPDGRCRAFDAEARERSLAAARPSCAQTAVGRHRDHDTVYAVIRGSAVNNDGAAKIGFTAPEHRRAGRGHRGGPGRR